MSKQRVEPIWLESAEDDPNTTVLAYPDGLGSAPVTGSYEDVLELDIVTGAPAVTVAAVQRNAKLLCQLWRQQGYFGRPHKILISPPDSRGPSGCASCGLSASLGGRRVMRSVDYVTAQLRMHVARQREQASNEPLDEFNRWLRWHPAFAALRYPDTASLLSGAYLIAEIGDPRWFVDPVKPDARKRLSSFLGLGHTAKSSIEEALASKELPLDGSTREARAALVLHTWTGGWFDPPRKDRLGDRSYFWDVFYQGKQDVAGFVRASRVFVQFLTDVWLDALTPLRVRKSVRTAVVNEGAGSSDAATRSVLQASAQYSPELFVPSHFFANSSKEECWSRIRDQWEAPPESLV